MFADGLNHEFPETDFESEDFLDRPILKNDKIEQREIETLDLDTEKKLLAIISRDSSSELKRAALSCLIFCNARVEAIERALFKFITSTDDESRSFGLKVSRFSWKLLSAEFQERIMHLIGPELDSSSSTKVESALSTLVGICNSELKPKIIQLTKDPRLSVRIAAARVLVSQKTSLEAWEELSELALNSPDWQVRNVVLAQLGKDSHLEAFEILKLSAIQEPLWVNQVVVAEQLLNGFGARAANTLVKLCINIEREFKNELLMLIRDSEKFGLRELEQAIVEAGRTLDIDGDQQGCKAEFIGCVDLVERIKELEENLISSIVRTRHRYLDALDVSIGRLNDVFPKQRELSAEALDFLSEYYSRCLNEEKDPLIRLNLVKKLRATPGEQSTLALLKFCETYLNQIKIGEKSDTKHADLHKALVALNERSYPIVCERLTPFLDIERYATIIGTIILSNMQDLELDSTHLELAYKILSSRTYANDFPRGFRGLKLRLCQEHYPVLNLLLKDLDNDDKTVRIAALSLLGAVKPEWFRAGLLHKVLNAPIAGYYDEFENHLALKIKDNPSGVFETWLINKLRAQREDRLDPPDYTFAESLAEFNLSGNSYIVLNSFLKERAYSEASVQKVLVAISNQSFNIDLFELVVGIVSNKNIANEYRRITLVILRNACAKLSDSDPDRQTRLVKLRAKANLPDFLIHCVVNESETSISTIASSILVSDDLSPAVLGKLRLNLSTASEPIVLNILRFFNDLIRVPNLSAPDFFRSAEFRSTFKYLFDKFPESVVREELIKFSAWYLYLDVGNIAEHIISDVNMMAFRDIFFAELGELFSISVREWDESRRPLIEELSYILLDDIKWVRQKLFSKDRDLKSRASKTMSGLLEKCLGL